MGTRIVSSLGIAIHFAMSLLKRFLVGGKYLLISIEWVFLGNPLNVYLGNNFSMEVRTTNRIKEVEVSMDGHNFTIIQFYEEE